MEIYLMLNGIQVGPYKFEDVQGWLSAGYVKLGDTAWYEGCEDWITLREVPGIEEISIPKSQCKIEDHSIPPFEAYEGEEPYIFVSYAHKDSDVIFKEINRLNDAGYNIWYDEGIEASSEWPEEIANAVLQCSLFLVFITPRSTASVNCRNEINLALNEDKPFLAVHMEKSALPPGLRLRMGDLQAILEYKLPRGIYEKKLNQALDHLLGKKKKNKRLGPSNPVQFAKSGYDPDNSVKRKRKGKNYKGHALKDKNNLSNQNSLQSKKEKNRWLWASIALLTLSFLGYFYLASDHDEEFDFQGQTWTVPSIGLKMIWCEPGTFLMGSPERERGRKEDETRHEVILSDGFFLGTYEVTQSQWKKIMGTSPSKFFGPNRPIEQITWNEAKRFCQELSLIEKNADRLPEGWVYELPTEAQWEYACRAGTNTMFYWGSAIGPSNANYSLGNVGETTDVGKYPPNQWGFHDMIGNVSEYCIDWYDEFDASSLSNPTGPEKGLEKLSRGGSWADTNENSRVAYRIKSSMDYRDEFKGFRLCLKKIGSAFVQKKEMVTNSFIKQSQNPNPQERILENQKIILPVPEKPWIVPSIGMEMLWCKSGTFLMGSPIEEPGRTSNENQTKFSFSKGFFLGKYEVTQKEYQSVMGLNPSKNIGDQFPLEMLGHKGAVEFCRKLTEIETRSGRLPLGWSYSLPRIEQWEYACRAGTKTAYSWGNQITPKSANYASSSIKTTSKVGSYQPNPWGFFDMHGNVWEWCRETGVKRGGSFANLAGELRSSRRIRTGPDVKSSNHGFRVSLQSTF